MFGVKGIGLNSLEKKSFFSFLALYIFSSMVFILLSGYWYYTAQKNALQSNDYYKLQHIADDFSQKIIASHMKSELLPKLPVNKLVFISLVDTRGEVVRGKIRGGFEIMKEGYFSEDTYTTLVSSSAQEHQGIKYVLVQSSLLPFKIEELKRSVIAVMIVVLIVMMILAWVLSKLFMRPLHQKIKQIEDFVHDTAHELNTPITALSMSVSRALKKQSYDETILKNISISTKQLFDIYTALSYLSFESKEQESRSIDIKEVLQKSVAYYQELSESKHISLNLSAESFSVQIDETKLTMLFGNLINNAIKYSHPSSEVDIVFKDKVITIEDYGIGIDKEKLSKIYEMYNRETEYAGGFGIGLSIVQKISQEYGLGLEVNSTLGKGSRFKITFL